MSLLAKTVDPDGNHDYTSLNAALTGNQQDLVSNDKYLVITISGTWSSADSVPTYDGYTTDATHYVKIITTGNARHAGIYSESKYYISFGSGEWILMFRSDLIVDGLQFKKTSMQGDDAMLARTSGYGRSGGNLVYANCIFKSTDTATTYVAHAVLNGNSQNHYLYNCIFQDIIGSSSGYTSTLRNAGTDLKAYNCTFINNTRVYYSDTVTAKNNGQSGSGNASTASSETTCSASTPTFAGSGDYHLASNDTTWKDQGTDVSGESFPVIGSLTTDIDGTTRSGTWDIGADEYVAAASTAAGFMTCNAGYWGP